VNFPLDFNFNVASGFRDMLPAMEWKIDRCRTKKVKIALYLIKIAKKKGAAAGKAKQPLAPQVHIGSIAGWPDSE